MEILEIRGKVFSVKEEFWFISSDEGKRIKIKNPFPCPARKGDLFYGFGIKLEKPEEKKDKTLYDILEVKKDSSPEEIKISYRKLAIKFHPDKNHMMDTTEIFQEISNAYDELGDPEKRMRYDHILKQKEGREQKKKKEEDVWKLVEPPMLKISLGEDNIKDLLKRALRCGKGKIEEIFFHLKVKVKKYKHESIQEYIDQTIAYYLRAPTEKVLEEIFPGQPKEGVLRFFRWWNDIMKRRFELLGLSREFVREIKRPPSELYEMIMDNPLKIPEIPLENAKEIMTRMNKPWNPTEEKCANMLRYVYKELENGNVFIPYAQLHHKFQLSADEFYLLEKFGVYGERETGRVFYRDAYLTNKELVDFLYKRLKGNVPKREVDMEKMNPNLTDTQKMGLFCALQLPLTIITGSAGCGKCLGKDTPILMFDGSIKMVQDIVLNDIVMGDDSTPRNVISTTTGQEMMYEIEQLYGDNYVVNESHILSLKLSYSPSIKHRVEQSSVQVIWCDERRQCSRTFSYKSTSYEYALTEAKKFASTLPQNGHIINISVKDYLSTTKSWKSAYKGYKVEVEYPEVDVLIDPYVLGCWIGDGTSHAPQITTIDQPIIEAFREAYPDLWVREGKNGMSYSLSSKIPFYGRNPFWDALKSLKLVGNKHIPECYIINSSSIRKQILAGIIDTDGHKHGNACYEITQKNENVANGIIRIARSLGYRATIRKCEKSCMYKGEKRTGIYHRMHISGADDLPVRLERKKSNPKRTDKNLLVYGIKVTKLNIGDYYGFEIDGNQRFVLGDYTVTHNSTLIGEIYKQEPSIALMSFTGKAVSRLSEITRTKDPATIHKIIANLDISEETRHIIIDEATMAYTDLILRLVVAFPYPTYNFRITLVGDPHQLPPITWGAFFEELINTKKVPIITLTQNMRVKVEENEEDGILYNCNKLLQHVEEAKTTCFVKPFSFKVTPNFQLRNGTAKDAVNILVSRKNMGLPIDDTVILTPYKDCVKELNELCNAEFKKGKKSVVDSRGNEWFIGSPICNRVNNYHKNIMNGDRGKIHDIEKDKLVVKINDEYVLFSTKVVSTFMGQNFLYESNKDLNEDEFTNTGTLMLDYASTVHSAQGSEWNHVIIYIPKGRPANFTFIDYRLVYTMISRAKKKVWIVGDIEALNVVAVSSKKKKNDNFGELFTQKFISTSTE